MNRSLMALSLCLASVTMAPAVHAQAGKSSVEVAATTGLPEFRDPKTGRVWTPENVGQGGKPILPEDHAFDPTNQSGAMQLVLQKAIAKPVGSVPISAGSTVPVVNMENTSLRAVPGQRWQLATYLNNNSGQAVDPVLECHFTNHGQLVAGTKVDGVPDRAGCSRRDRRHGSAGQLLRRQGLVPGDRALTTRLGGLARPLRRPTTYLSHLASALWPFAAWFFHGLLIESARRASANR